MLQFHLSKIILEQTVAIKAIDMKGVRDSASRQMLDYEIEALTTLNHQNIMKCYDVIKQTSFCYIITELCYGGDLGQILKKKGRLSEQQTLKYLKGIVKAYIQIGDKGFLHRDLKLANVLVNNGQAKIADFGFAKKCRSNSIKQRYNVGSPLYMSPEALKHNIYSTKNDIWSIGIMAYEMLHGDTPWQCKTQQQLIDKMSRVPVKFRDTLKISSDSKDFIRKCLEINQSKRMSLQGLKQWIVQIEGANVKQNIQNIPNYQPKLLQKPTTFDKLDKDHQIRPLSQITNRIPHSQNSKSVNKIQLNNYTQANAKTQLTKSVINYNNNMIIKQIILFRLFFKTLQKLKNSKQITSPVQLKNIIGNETIRRVTLLKKLICSQQTKTNQYFSLKNIQSYLNPIFNPDIKKYKTVIQQYFTKYTSEVKMQILQGKQTPSQIITTFLKGIPSNLIQKQSLLFHWLLNLISANTTFPKSQLEQILQPKQQIKVKDLKQNIQLICR